MPQNLLEQLRKFTVVVADTGDIEAMEKFRPQDATTNPSLITAAAPVAAVPAHRGRGRCSRRARNWATAQPTLLSPTWPSSGWPSPSGKRFWPSFPAASPPKSTPASPTTPRPPSRRPAPSSAQYDDAGIGRNRVLIKIASTWEGIRAAEVLEKEGIHCNLTLLFGLHQAIACGRGRRHADLAVRGPHPRLVQEGHRQGLPRRRRSRRASPSPGSTTTTRTSATRPRSWAPASATSVRLRSWPAATC